MNIELADISHYLNSLYSSVYNIVVFILAVITSFRLSFGDNSHSRISASIPVLLLCAALIAFLGLTTQFGVYIGDTAIYEYGFRHIDETTTYFPFSANEGLFKNLQIFTYRLGGHQYASFNTLIAFLYVSTLLIASYKIMRDHMWVAILFFITSFSFLGYGVNGIRNGVACHIVILGIIYLIERNKWSQVLACALFLSAFMIHRSTILPITLALVVKYFNLNPVIAIRFWVISIFISLLVGNVVSDFFLNLDFDERTRYFQDASDVPEADAFSSTGFRFDFLLYSAMPVLMAWYVTVKRNFQDTAFNIIANTYILSNAFWIMVIRASYSNRFAYLSWFLYPLVIAYPLLRMNIWENQNRKTALILFAYSGFTFFMYFIYYG